MTSNELGALSDQDLLAYLQQYVTTVLPAPALFGLTALQATAMQTLTNALATELTGWTALQPAYDAQRIDKDAARASALSEVRSQRNQVKADPLVPESNKAQIGIDPRDTTATPSPSPTTAPFGRVEYAKLRHTIHFRDATTPGTSAKPKGMLGCEIWMHTGTSAPATESDYQFLALDTATPYEVVFQMADAGKHVRYLLRWVSKNGDKGGWSEVIEATVNG